MNEQFKDRFGNLLSRAYGDYEVKVYFRKKKYDTKTVRDEQGQIVQGAFKEVWNGDLEDKLYEFNENHANQVIRNNSAYVEVGKPAKLGTVGKVSKPKITKKQQLAAGVITEKGGAVEPNGKVHQATVTVDGDFKMIS